jgi:hypothetical protein
MDGLRKIIFRRCIWIGSMLGRWKCIIQIFLANTKSFCRFGTLPT